MFQRAVAPSIRVVIGLVFAFVSVTRAQAASDEAGRVAVHRATDVGSTSSWAAASGRDAEGRPEVSTEARLGAPMEVAPFAADDDSPTSPEEPAGAGPTAASGNSPTDRGAGTLLRDRAGWMGAHALAGAGFGYLTGRYFEFGPKWMTRNLTASLDDKERGIAYGALSASIALVLARLVATKTPDGTGPEFWLENTAGVGMGSGLAGGGVFVGYRAGIEFPARASVGLTVQSHSWRPSQELDERFDGQLDAVSATQLTVDARLLMPILSSGAQVFVQGGLGRYRPSLAHKTFGISYAGGGTPGGLGFHGGLGMNLRRGENVGVGVLALYHVMPSAKDLQSNLNEATLGLTLRWRVGR